MIAYAEYDEAIKRLAMRIRKGGRGFTSVCPVPRGGYYPAIKIASLTGLPLVTEGAEQPGTLMVDDIVDSGRTMERYAGRPFAAVYWSGKGREPDFYGFLKGDSFLLFPDERQGSIDEQIRRILQYIGDDPDRQGLRDTPDRVIRMWREIFRGYDPSQRPKVTVFDNGADGIVYDSMVIDTGDYHSLCEHHMMPFFGKYWFAYVPSPEGKILGLSKIGRVVDYCSARLQVQERLVHDVVETLSEALGKEHPPLGMAMVMQGEHLCKTMRGARKRGLMTSSFLTGAFMESESLRAEFMQFVNKRE